ncbi:Asp23/Gls24 family envelope stress response protein [Howardella ureilytica]|nr:Asp23/Gls24 family envelope stress response protein [Lachnospiraceae bacterium]MDY2956229.1 Asp23/Gls24 family envelope stress response protein [Lachnospiraceae bacterium]
MTGNSKGNIKYSIKDRVGIAEISISDEVLIVIAALATTEVEGVASLSGNITNAVASRLGAGKLSKGVKIHINNRVISVDVSINIKDGYAIPDVSSQVQTRVKQAIETMTGLSVDKVNVRITGVSVENE